MRKQFIMLALLGGSALFFACGGGNVIYNLACQASCASTGATSSVALSACSGAGQDPNQIAASNVQACVSAAQDAGCPDPTCACQAARTTQACVGS